MAFSKLKIGQSFTHKGTEYVKMCAVSAESPFAVTVFDKDTPVEVA